MRQLAIILEDAERDAGRKLCTENEARRLDISGPATSADAHTHAHRVTSAMSASTIMGNVGTFAMSGIADGLR